MFQATWENVHEQAEQAQGHARDKLIQAARAAIIQYKALVRNGAEAHIAQTLRTSQERQTSDMIIAEGALRKQTHVLAEMGDEASGAQITYFTLYDEVARMKEAQA